METTRPVERLLTVRGAARLLGVGRHVLFRAAEFDAGTARIVRTLADDGQSLDSPKGNRVARSISQRARSRSSGPAL